MPVSEALLLAALSGVLVLALWISAPRRLVALVVAGIAVAVCAAIAVAHHRWQAFPALVFGALLAAYIALRRQHAPLTRPLAIAVIVLLTVATYAPLYLFPIFSLPEPGGWYAV